MADAKRLGRQIEAARNERGWTQEELAEKLGRGGAARTIQSWEAGERVPRKSTLDRLRVLLGMPGDEAETRADWPIRVQQLIDALCDPLAALPAKDLRALRSEFIRGLFHESPGQNRQWPDDVEVIAMLMGGWLAADTRGDES